MRRKWRWLWVVLVVKVAAAVAAVVAGRVGAFLDRCIPPDRPVSEVAAEPVRPRLGPQAAARVVAADLDSTDPADRPFQRYLSFVHRHDDPTCPPDALAADRAAVAAAVAALAAGGPPPRAVDPDRVIFRVDLRTIGWDADADWRRLVVRYPYGLSSGSADDRRAADLTGDPLPVVRADWFVFATAPGRDYPPPAAALARDYPARPVSSATAAAELGLDDPSQVVAAVRAEAHLADEFGLAPLTAGRVVAREWWETDRHLVSPYQELARRLGVGRPVRLR